ncbi:formate dehydrogenase subunit gamma [Paraburkholderia hospita]|uniref:Formate dehydrogenase subunit gamma n=1 Tax=Paraburkholderia hospita TaxID=169430 RepID=A0ABN0F3T4_9BURK|nr:formate dehydrogenase subunit gamma [Paraburkholderia hospita]EIM93123.1 formate dehydrogenase subunit gamma [Paraburkholderia hospita]OUL90254.1 formate dehydrogenase subunit gamma [Paraburkholderia hospita]
MTAKPRARLLVKTPGKHVDPRWALLREVVAGHAARPGGLLPALHNVQDRLGFVPPELISEIALEFNLSRAEVHGVITFYPHFRSAPAGRHTLEVCRAESCQALGAERLAEHARSRLGCDFHATTGDGAFSLEPVYCLGLCAQSPAVMLDGQPHARVTPDKLDRLLDVARELEPYNAEDVQ